MRFTVFFLFCWMGLAGQSTEADSLRQFLSNASSDVQRAELCLEIATIFQNKNWGDSCLYYNQRAIRLAEQAGRRDLVAKAILKCAQMHISDGRYAEAVESYTEGVRLSHVYGLRFDTFRAYLHLAGANAALGRMPLAVAHLDSAGTLVAPKDRQRAMLHARVTANVLDAQNRYEEALVYRRRALALVSDTSPPGDQLRSLFGMVFDLSRLNQHDSAIHYIHQALPLALRFQDYYMEWHFRGNLGMNLIKKGQYEEGLAAFRAADALLPMAGNNICCGNGSYQALALVRLGRKQEALRYIQQAEAFLPDNAIERRNNLATLVQVYEEMENYEGAFSALKRLKVTDDSLTRREHQQAAADLEIRYRTREQAETLAEQKAQIARQRWYVLVALLIAGLLGALAWQYRRTGQARRQVARAIEVQHRALKELDAAKSRFFANISHEFRTPLTLMLAPIEEAMKTVKEYALRDQLAAARRSAERLLRLVEELLDLSRLEAGKMELHLEEMPVASWFQQHIAEFASLAATKRIQLLLEVQCENSLRVCLDTRKLEKIFQNLLGNALKFTDRNGLVRCVVACESDTLRVHVQDTGPGITPTELLYIFDRFYQGSAFSETGGAGIGLALSQELARLMGGGIRAESEQGVGSVFTLTLPVQIPALSVSRVSEDMPTEPGTPTPPEDRIFAAFTFPPAPFRIESDRSKPVLLVVEDHPDLRHYLEQILSNQFQVLLAEDGLEALRQLERTRVDLVVSDVMMPRMGGFDLLRQVRRQPAVFQQIPFVFLTARALEADKLQALQLGVDDYLTKPFDPPMLIARIQNLLQTHEKRQKRGAKQGTTPPDNSDLALLKQAEQWVLDHIDNPDMSVGGLAGAVAHSPRNLDRTLRRLTGFTPVEFIREIRLQRAHQLIQQGRYSNVSDLRLAVGIENPAYFSRIFTLRFGIGPKEMMKSITAQHP